jgi:ubiquinone/menaquinone biosynthesis C-methylase UbiE
VILTKKPDRPQIIDYEGSQYRTDFWEGQGREYEDLAERNAISRLLPGSGGVLMEAGAGFGRLAQLYDGYEKVLLVDYSLSLLQEARHMWGHDDRFTFVAASIYELPFVSGLLDSLVMIRVMHHLQQPGSALAELARIVNGGGVFVVEYANKRNLKAILRYWAGRQSWSPFSPEPYEFVSLNFDFHPAWMLDVLQRSGFAVHKELSVSLFRMQAIKQRVSPDVLARVDAALASPAAALRLSPSMMLRCVKEGYGVDAQGFFRCPACCGVDLREGESVLACEGCGREWPFVDGIYDFRFVRDSSGVGEN